MRRSFEHEMIVADTKDQLWMKKVDAALQERGRQGWEMVSVLHTMQNVVVFLKRESTIA